MRVVIVSDDNDIIFSFSPKFLLFVSIQTSSEYIKGSKLLSL